ncbi:ABC transporter permease [Deinococcus aetherius]|uniref:ABC transporter permease n=1 Tax=Deinococcus aetherius TaxID=200252 RepID=A0ABN6RG94_9DEIO|nr:ABC transporter permease [Deinococcus aetherius]BDP42387.1 ABC transporter permease [Deinococcus aetherius]
MTTTPPPLAKAPDRLTLRERLPSVAILGPLLALLLAVIFFSTQSDRFLSPQNFSLIFQQVSYVAVLAIGQTLIILTSGIDLAAGVIMALGGVVMTRLAVNSGLNPYLAIGLGLLATTFVGWINGLLITRLRLPPFIVTLGMFGIVFGFTQVYSRSETVSSLPDPLTFFGSVFRIGATSWTYGTVLMLALYLLTHLILTQTSPGRHLYAVGNNPEAARLTGIPTNRVILLVYTLAGLTYGIAALLLTARTGVGDPNAGQTEALASITAVVLGGTSLFGGRGAVVGTLLGALIVGVFTNGLTLMGVPSVYQYIITGVLTILAVAVDQLSRRKA